MQKRAEDCSSSALSLMGANEWHCSRKANRESPTGAQREHATGCVVPSFATCWRIGNSTARLRSRSCGWSGRVITCASWLESCQGLSTLRLGRQSRITRTRSWQPLLLSGALKLPSSGRTEVDDPNLCRKMLEL